MAEQLTVAIREDHGKRRVRRMRRVGRIPAVLYGHGQQNISLSVPTPQISAAVRQGAKVVELTGGVNDTALIREVQWDPFGVDLWHVDFLRVSVGETVQTTVTVELRGVSPGANEGGVVEQLQHEVDIECPVKAMPDRLEVNINLLHVGQSLTAAELSLPEGARLVTEPHLVLVQCLAKAAEVEEEEGVPTEGAEPEVIGRKAEEEASQD